MNIHDTPDDADEHDDDHEHPVSNVKLGDIEALRGVVKFPVRIKCATLAWFTMEQGFREIETAAS